MNATTHTRLTLSFVAALVAIMLLALAGSNLPQSWAAETENANGATNAGTGTTVAKDASLFASGSGTTEDPYIIQTADQLKAFRDSVNDGNTYEGDLIQITADIDISGSEWTPIGAGLRKGSGAGAASMPFKGILNGTDHTVSGLTITSTPNIDSALGFIGILDGGQLKNLKLADVSIDVPTSKLAGGAVGLAIGNATVSGIEVSGKLVAEGGVGGIVGRMTIGGVIAECTNNADITAGSDGNAGGIVGAAYYTTLPCQMVIDGCTNTGAINGSQAIGGIVGLGAAFVNNSTNTGIITASNYSAGGIVGEQRNYGAVHHCTNEGAVTTIDASGFGTGGIVGWVRYNGAATAYQASSPVAITDSTNKGIVKGGDDAGGIVGTMYDAGTVVNNTNEAPSLSGTTFAGGIVGNLQTSGDATLPTGVSEGIRVENNVSTTPLEDITAADKGQFAYNNDATKFTVQDNGTAWVAEVNGVEFATVNRAVDMAGNGGTAKLIADATEAATVTETSGATTTLDLNGHSLDFATSPAFDVEKGELVMTDTGKVFTDGTKLTDLVASATSSTVGTLALEGGTYTQDVEPYVAEGYAELVHHEAPDGARFQVLPADQAKAGATASVTTDGRTEYFQNTEDAKLAAAARPGSQLTIFDQMPTTAPGTATDPATDPADGTAPMQPDTATTDVRTLQAIPANVATGGDLARTGDDAWPYVVLGFSLIVLSGVFVAFAARRSFQR